MYKYCILSFENGMRRVTKVKHEWSQRDCEYNFLNVKMQVSDNKLNESRLISTVVDVDLIDYLEEKI